jgi:hypothetical protein
MGPFICEGSFPGFNHPHAHGIFLAQITILLLNCRSNRPATIGGVFKMLYQRDVIFLPSIERFVTKKAGNIVWIAWSWEVEEPGFCNLNAYQ